MSSDPEDWGSPGIIVNNALQVVLVRTEASKQAAIDASLNKDRAHRTFGKPLFDSMAQIARDLSPQNLAILAKLRKLGHVSQQEAALELGHATARSFVMAAMSEYVGINLYLDFAPLPDGQPGVRVNFDKLIIDLDF